MMKRLVSIVSMIALCASGASVYVPKANERQMVASPLRHAELCWIENTNKTATAYIGGKDGAQLRITDPAALRGARIRKLALGEFSVSASSGFTYNAEKDEYTITSAETNTIIITVPANYTVTDFGYNVVDKPNEGDITPLVSSIGRLERAGNTAVITFVKGNAPRAIVNNISVYAKAFGDTAGVNDLTLTTFLLKDSLGQIDFANLRHWAAHLYDGNRGEHWSAYPAKSTVRLAGQPVMYDDDKTFTSLVSLNTQLVFQARTVQALSIEPRDAEMPSYTYFYITSIDSTEADVTITYAHDINGFNLDELGVLWAEELKGIWYALPESDYTATGDTVNIPRIKFGRCTGFFKLVYHGSMSSAVRITLRGSVIVKDALILRGADSKYYKITVSGGSLSAEEVSL